MNIQNFTLVVFFSTSLSPFGSFSKELALGQAETKTTSTQVQNILEITVRKNKFRLPRPSNAEMRELGIHQLSPNDFNDFIKTRADFLNHAAHILQSLKLGFGIGYIIKNKYQFYKEKKTNQSTC